MDPLCLLDTLSHGSCCMKLVFAQINGESTVKTNTLDVGGFKIALKSYWYAKMLLDEHEINGLAYSPEKLFFIGFAQVVHT